MCSLIVAGSDCFEAFLASGIPDLELNCLAINLDGFDFKIDANCWHKVVGENIILYCFVSKITQFKILKGSLSIKVYLQRI